MSGCTGPCNQGRLPCPCPSACGLDEPPEPDIVRAVLKDIALSAAVIAVIALIVIGVAR